MKNLNARWIGMMLATALGLRGKAPAMKSPKAPSPRRHYDGIHTRKSRSKKTYLKWHASKENGQ